MGGGTGAGDEACGHGFGYLPSAPGVAACREPCAASQSADALFRFQLEFPVSPAVSSLCNEREAAFGEKKSCLRFSLLCHDS